MIDPSAAYGQESKRYPLSLAQEWFLTMDKGDDGGPFGRRYLIVSALRVTGHVDLAVLQSALDDVVARHELLRTLVIRDADPPYQQVFPPCQVPLQVRDLPRVTGTSRDTVMQELILKAQAGTMSARQVPLLRALLCRFDDRDSVLFVTVHHSVSDGWSIQVILRDLGALYAARVSGTPPIHRGSEACMASKKHDDGMWRFSVYHSCPRGLTPASDGELTNAENTMHYVTVSPPVPLGSTKARG
jgi:hypothetical protein